MDEPLFDSEVSGNSGDGPDPPVHNHGWNPVSYFVDTARLFNGGHTPPKNVRDRVGAEARKLVKEGIEETHLRKGIEILVDKALDPSMLPSCVFTAQCKPDTPTGPERERRSEEAEMIRVLLVEHDGRWPTGARFVRSEQSGHTVFDPLGYDPRPGDFPYPRPSRDDVLSALRSSP